MTGKRLIGRQMPLYVPYVRVHGVLIRAVAITSALVGNGKRAHWRDGTWSLVSDDEVVWKHELVDVDYPES